MSGPYEYRTPPPPPPAPVPAQPAAYSPASVPRPTAPVPTAAPSSAPFFSRTRQLVWIAIAVVDLILALRFAFIALAANDVGFVQAMERAGIALAYPFRGIFGNSIRSGHVLEWVDLCAI